MSSLSKELILAALSKIKYHNEPENIVKAGMVDSIVIDGQKINLILKATLNEANANEEIRKECEQTILTIPGVSNVAAILTAEKNSDSHNIKPTSSLPHVKNIIAVASGKGGVGKSTVAVQLATMLELAGHNVGIVDADIYGPSIPYLLGDDSQEKPTVNDDGYMQPMIKHNIQLMSMGYLIDQEKAAVWRAPMIVKALLQLFKNTAWDNLDYLIVDTPPGTGDIHLTLAKNSLITGVVLVSTPQELALLDVRKAMDMFRKVNVPILGVIENMSYYLPSDSKEKQFPFGKDGAKHFAINENIPFLGQIPFSSYQPASSDGSIRVDSKGVSPDIIESLIFQIHNRLM